LFTGGAPALAAAGPTSMQVAATKAMSKRRAPTRAVP
jgi:hypothetical protein